MIVNVSGLVYKPVIISTSFITGTGFIKCIPITLSGLVVAAAIFVSEIEEVFEARITFFFVILSSAENIFFLTSKSSVTAYFF